MRAGNRVGPVLPVDLSRGRRSVLSRPFLRRPRGGVGVRLKGVEPSRALAHTDLNRARLPVPPQPRDLQIYWSGRPGRAVPVRDRRHGHPRPLPLRCSSLAAIV
jgi:hypothetical protein